MPWRKLQVINRGFLSNWVIQLFRESSRIWRVGFLEGRRAGEAVLKLPVEENPELERKFRPGVFTQIISGYRLFLLLGCHGTLIAAVVGLLADFYGCHMRLVL